MLSVEIEPGELTGRGQRYNVYLGGELIVRGSLDPEYDAARALMAMGNSGSFETVDAVTGRTRMRFKSIHSAARLEAHDGPKGPSTRKRSAIVDRMPIHGPKEQQTIEDPDNGKCCPSSV